MVSGGFQFVRGVEREVAGAAEGFVQAARHVVEDAGEAVFFWSSTTSTRMSAFLQQDARLRRFRNGGQGLKIFEARLEAGRAREPAGGFDLMSRAGCGRLRAWPGRI